MLKVLSPRATRVGIQAIELFPLLLIKYHWDQSELLNENLTNLIHVKEADDPGISTTNVGGWHSKKNLHLWQGECIQTLVKRIRWLSAVMANDVLRTSYKVLPPDWQLEAWANVSRAGDSNKFHTHLRHQNLWSGIYYVQANTGKGAGRTVFEDQFRPMIESSKVSRTAFYVVPTPGLMLLFPSSLGHRVEQHFGDKPRITIAFNLKHPDYSTLNYESEKKG